MGYQLNQVIKLSDIAQYLDLEFKGLDIEINGVAPLKLCQSNELTFSKTFDPNLNNSAFILSDMEGADLDKNGYIISDKPRLDFIRALDYLSKEIGFSSYNYSSEIHPSVQIGQNVVIERGCKIAEGVVIEHNVVIHAGTNIGKNSRIRSNSSIGSDGFGFERLADGTPLRFPHLGGVEIGENVEIGACTTVARGTLSNTQIEDYVKIDNLVHIAHNCLIKRGAFIIACAEISGGVIVGENAWVAPNSCTHQKVSIGNGALVGLGAVITKDVPANMVYAGNPAKKIREMH
ncbi:UDP-3-O-[3-hydroxymyristoyl] glucosamine N-acyltransferase [Acinetobacter dispersus]|uniref:UDP-3-O-(3-hydroxymyristoyl)glucosamine N-acyltransferase n=1 Tax=Acinetobacter dispersus TaxID=70348 RepID=UPI0002CE4B7A|nr:UDP-3-O-(3-hydroxymyristoyl)glucosamine N-acyltransferase [Acinetobacter dispersus]ENX53875.1 UDP-3-O-[3-hydroxymyristoyl] glucosamine N-acyltransferase [Acinetobacter dispersus]